MDKAEQDPTAIDQVGYLIEQMQSFWTPMYHLGLQFVIDGDLQVKGCSDVGAKQGSAQVPRDLRDSTT